MFFLCFLLFFSDSVSQPTDPCKGHFWALVSESKIARDLRPPQQGVTPKKIYKGWTLGLVGTPRNS